MIKWIINILWEIGILQKETVEYLPIQGDKDDYIWSRIDGKYVREHVVTYRFDICQAWPQVLLLMSWIYGLTLIPELKTGFQNDVQSFAHFLQFFWGCVSYLFLFIICWFWFIDDYIEWIKNNGFKWVKPAFRWICSQFVLTINVHVDEHEVKRKNYHD